MNEKDIIAAAVGLLFIAVGMLVNVATAASDVAAAGCYVP